MFAEERERRYISRYNQYGIRGWYINSKYNLERYLYLLQRITGLGLLAFLILHIIMMSSRMYGETVYERVHSILNNPYADVGLAIVILALLFHGFNGIRLIINEFGFMLSKPKRPIYPYRVSIKTGSARGLTFAMMALAAIFYVFVVYEFLMVWWFG